MSEAEHNEQISLILRTDLLLLQTVRVSRGLVGGRPQLPGGVVRAAAQPGLALHHGEAQLLLHLASPRRLHLPPRIQGHRYEVSSCSRENTLTKRIWYNFQLSNKYHYSFHKTKLMRSQKI